MSTHNLCFRAKIRKKYIPLYTPVLLYKVGCKGVFLSRTCFRDASNWGVRGYSFHGLVFVMHLTEKQSVHRCPRTHSRNADKTIG